MARPWPAACCLPSMLPSVFPTATCERSRKLSTSSELHSNGGLLLQRRFSCRDSVSNCRLTGVQCNCSSSSNSESHCSDSSPFDSHFATRRQLIVSGAAAVSAVAFPSYAVEVPQTVMNFKAMCTGEAGSSYEGTIFNRVLQGQFIQAGRQGSRDKGEALPPTKLERNEEVVRGNSFKLRHRRPGTVSLCLSENDDEETIKLNPEYRNVEFMITTGPGPAPKLDNGNIVFGVVLEGMDVVAAVSTVPTYKPSGRIQQFNWFAQLLGDDRAASARANWEKPLKSVVIKKCGLLNIA